MATLTRISPNRPVTYSCGSCGYELNLHSSDRNTSNIDSKYGKAIRKGIVSFVAIDESRFSVAEEIGCVSLFGRRTTKLMCRKCRNFIGVAYGDGKENSKCCSSSSSSSKKYDVRISALQPSGNSDYVLA